ncbi:MAG: hypothetical protein ACJ72Z_00325, partial [Pyrinomonadaceae bacterium]
MATSHIYRSLIASAAISLQLLATACGSNDVQQPVNSPTTLGQIPAVRLNYRYEADVPPPTETVKAASEERNAAIQTDFDQNRAQEVLDKTFASANGKRIAALYHRLGDLPSEFRLDMYGDDGKLLHKMTADLMAVHFPDTIRWSPDSESLAFVAMLRGVQNEPE